MNTVWFDMSKLNWDLEGPVMDGILGQEFMKRYLVTINFTMREVSFYNYENVLPGTVVNQDAERTSND
jgi:hypothetical protein